MTKTAKTVTLAIFAIFTLHHFRRLAHTPFRSDKML